MLDLSSRMFPYPRYTTYVDNSHENKKNEFQVEEGPNGGAVAAAVISSIVVVVLLMGAAFYIVMRTRFVPRLRARMTNTPYECANLSQPPQMNANATSLP